MSKLSESTKQAIEAINNSITKLNTRFKGDKVCIKYNSFINKLSMDGVMLSVFNIYLANKGDDKSNTLTTNEVSLHGYEITLVYGDDVTPVTNITNIKIEDNNSRTSMYSVKNIDKNTKGFVINGIPNTMMLLDSILMPMYMVAKAAVTDRNKQRNHI